MTSAKKKNTSESKHGSPNVSAYLLYLFKGFSGLELECALPSMIKQKKEKETIRFSLINRGLKRKKIEEGGCLEFFKTDRWEEMQDRSGASPRSEDRGFWEMVP
ncbi:MAG: hypothetical protein Q8P67_19335 [archaeon]|nr:hypothetical protein [archaeon]